jgi:hypothetical protein
VTVMISTVKTSAEFVTTCSALTTSTSGSVNAMFLIALKSNPYTSSQTRLLVTC